jgi:hypothetical protein
MDPAIVGALAAVLGSLAGGSATVAAGWVTQRTQGRRELIHADIREREQVYSRFIGECSRLLIDALDHTFGEPQKLGKAYELLNRIRPLRCGVGRGRRIVRPSRASTSSPIFPRAVRLLKAEGSIRSAVRRACCRFGAARRLLATPARTRARRDDPEPRSGAAPGIAPIQGDALVADAGRRYRRLLACATARGSGLAQAVRHALRLEARRNGAGAPRTPRSSRVLQRRTGEKASASSTAA